MNHWVDRENRTVYVGLLGQKIFDLILTQLRIPADRNDPTVEWQRSKPYDFYIEGLGSIEVKCFDYWCRKVLIKVSEWHSNNYLVVFKLGDKEAKEVSLYGYLTKEQVEDLDVSKKGEKYTPYADAYITDFDSLNRADEFIEMLKPFSLLEKEG